LSLCAPVSYLWQQTFIMVIKIDDAHI
jgi:hypothetical protein